MADAQQKKMADAQQKKKDGPTDSQGAT